MTEQVSIAKSAKIVGRHLCTGPIINWKNLATKFELFTAVLIISYNLINNDFITIFDHK